MKILIAGTGGIGGYVGGKLAKSGEDVVFLARGQHYQELKSHGLTVFSTTGNIRLDKVNVIANAGELQHADLVVIAVKLWELQETLRGLSRVVSAKTTILSLQCGIHVDHLLRIAFPHVNILRGVCYIDSSIVAPGIIQHRGVLQRFIIGNPEGQPCGRSRLIADMIARAQINVILSNDIARSVWENFLFEVGFSGATAAHRKPIGAFQGDLRGRCFLRGLLEEAASVVRLAGGCLKHDAIARQLAFVDSLPQTMTSSMHRDLSAGYQTEVDWLNGRVCALAEHYGISVPFNQLVFDLVSNDIPCANHHQFVSPALRN